MVLAPQWSTPPWVIAGCDPPWVWMIRQSEWQKLLQNKSEAQKKQTEGQVETTLADYGI